MATSNGRLRPLTSHWNAIYGIQQKLKTGTMRGLVLWSAWNGLLDDYSMDG